MQFRGSLRSPGDRGPGVRVVLVVDEYHLEIRADDDLIGRYYLADVEVARDIAERFILFLHDGEMEFLADDALKFAYDGVAAMQEAWLIAQKKRRRHRKAAVQSARRKDREPAPEPEPVATRAQEELARPQRSRQGDRRTPEAAPSELAKRLAAAAASAAPVPVLEPAASGRRTTATASNRNGQGNRRRDAAKPVAAPASVDPPETLAPPPIEELPSPFDAVEESRPDESKARVKDGRRAKKGNNREAAKLTAASAPTIELPPVPIPAAPVKRTAVRTAPVKKAPVKKAPAKEAPVKKAAPVEEAPVEEAPVKGATAVEVEDPLAVRFAADGHHPSETSGGLMSFLRRSPKIPDNHVHKFRESGSAVGLVRRVCIECSYVSIGSDD